MAVKTIEAVAEKTEVKKQRGVEITLEGKKYFIRKPKAKDFITIEERVGEKTSNFIQGLVMVDVLCDELSYEYLEDLYIEDLGPIFDAFEQLMPAQKFAALEN